MRIISFEEYWPKLHDARFTTFRFTRRDRDWEQGEQVQVVVNTRSKNRQPLGIAKISDKIPGYAFPQDIEFCSFPCHAIELREAIVDGFENRRSMHDHFVVRYGKKLLEEPLNKLVLMWIERY